MQLHAGLIPIRCALHQPYWIDKALLGGACLGTLEMSQHGYHVGRFAGCSCSQHSQLHCSGGHHLTNMNSGRGDGELQDVDVVALLHLHILGRLQKDIKVIDFQRLVLLVHGVDNHALHDCNAELLTVSMRSNLVHSL